MAGEYWRDWNVDPALNTEPPPVGAPEGGTKIKHLNDIARRIQAACRQLGDAQDALGNMSAQNKNAVDIDGGTIDGVTISNTNSIAGDAIKTGTVPAARLPTVNNAAAFGGLTPQQWYDALYPVGRVVFDVVEVAPVVPAGITANWVQVGYYGRFIKIAQPTTLPAYPALSGTITNIPTAAAGGHNHGGKTGGTALTIPQIPAHSHSYSRTGGSGSVIGGGGPYSNVVATETSEVGGGAAHDHTISSVADHTHNINPNDVPSLALAAWRRIS